MNKEPQGLENLFPYLEQHLGIQATSTAITQFKGGYSNLTFLIHSPEKDWVLRRPPLGLKIAKGHDMVREYRILEALKKSGYAKIPDPVLCCEDESVIGAPFFIMEKVDGLILRNRIPTGMELDPGFFHQLSINTLDGLLELHQLEMEESGLAKMGKPEGYVERQVIGWSERYYQSKTHELTEMEKTSRWLLENMPKIDYIGFIHNDYKYDNLVLESPDDPNIKAVLDWEMATVGDPLMDLGTSLAYWAEPNDPDILKMFSLTHAPGNLTRLQAIQYYGLKSPLPMENMVFYYAYGLFKVGVIAQQIFKRYSMGFAKDERFAGLIHAVEACGKKAIKSIETEKI